MQEEKEGARALDLDLPSVPGTHRCPPPDSLIDAVGVPVVATSEPTGQPKGTETDLALVMVAAGLGKNVISCTGPGLAMTAPLITKKSVRPFCAKSIG